MAAVVTLTCIVVAFPIAFYMARLASPRMRGLLLVSILLPLWSGYLVKVYAWRLILSQNGVLNWVLAPFGLEGPGYSIEAVWLVESYLWLPYMIIPIYAGLERIPSSLLEASADLGGRGRDHVPAGHPAAGPAGRHRRLDLHVQPDPRRLHHADPRLEHEVHRQRRLRPGRRRRQPAARRRVRDGPGHDHARLPARRPPARRVRGALMGCPALGPAIALRLATMRDPRVHLRPDRDHRPVLVQRGQGRDLADHVVHDRLVRQGVQRPGHPGRDRRPRSRPRSARRRRARASARCWRSRSRAISSSAARSIAFIVILPLALPGIVTGLALKRRLPRDRLRRSG